MSDVDASIQVSKLRIPRLEEISFEKLRASRLARLQQSMLEHDVPICLLVGPANIRYATGTDAFYVISHEEIHRYCIVPAEGAPVLFEFPGSIHHSEKIVNDVRPARLWSDSLAGPDDAGIWAKEIHSLMEELTPGNNVLAVDRLDTQGFLALIEEGIRLTDSRPVTVDAREIKTPEEVDLFKINGAIGSAMLSEFEAAIRPGIPEYELLAVLHRTLFRYQGEYGFLRMVGSGTNTNPWHAEAHDKIVMPGDLVAVDTDAHGYQGYVIDSSRTFLCGDVATPEQKEAYRVAYEAVTTMVATVRPGMTYAEFAESVPPLPEKYQAQRYGVMVHVVGLEDADGPSIPYPGQAPMPDRVIQENMVMCFECYAGTLGGCFGVKLEDQALITADGAEILVPYSYEAKLLA